MVITGHRLGARRRNGCASSTDAGVDGPDVALCPQMSAMRGALARSGSRLGPEPEVTGTSERRSPSVAHYAPDRVSLRSVGELAIEFAEQ
jgi:hypothetical protein